jgi:hypothetical protein
MPATTGPRVLIVIPGNVNYFYNLNGRRLAEGLTELGCEAVVHTLRTAPTSGFDWVLLSNVSEILVDFGNEEAGIERLRALGRTCGRITASTLECVQTRWFRANQELNERVGVDAVLDVGLWDQSAALQPADRAGYRFLPAGLTASERRLLATLDEDDTERTIPWTFVGHGTSDRAALAAELIRDFDPTGFLYLPRLAPCLEKGSPLLNQRQFEQVLRRTRFQVWCSHHGHFYVEPERFRMSALTGGLPVKVVPPELSVPDAVPFRYLFVDRREVAGWLHEADFVKLRRRFREGWRRQPPLSAGLARELEERGLSSAEPAAAAA